MKAALLGLPGSGRKTLMEALAGNPGRVIQPSRKSVVTVRVPDARVDRLAAYFRPRKTTPATVELTLDLTPFESTAARLQAARYCEVLVVLAGAFGRGDQSAQGALDDVDLFLDEMLLADQIIVERRLELLAKKGVRGPERRVLERALDALNDSRPLRDMTLIEAELALLAPFSFLTLKPVLAVLNVAEEEQPDPAWPTVEARLCARGVEPVALCAPLEREVSQLPPEEQVEFAEALGLEAPASHRLVRTVFRALDLISFFTVGEDEVRAWPVRAGARAPEAASRIHTDLQRGFIRVEVVSYAHFLLTGSLARARKTGRLRTEGKNYVVNDGDIANFLFNV